MSATHLTPREREVISQMHTAGHSHAEIARCVGRHRGTIGRELARNSIQVEHGAWIRTLYFAVDAQQLAEARRRDRPVYRKLDDPQLACEVKTRLKQRWSPEQIAGRLKEQQRHDRSRSVSHQTIYAWIRQKSAEQPWYRNCLCRRGRRYRYGTPSYRGRFPERRKIEDRPGEVNTRQRIGDWEGDTVHGRCRSGVIATYVDRRSGYLVAGRLPRLDSYALTSRTRRLFGKIEPSKLKTLTLDNGVEFSDHVRMECLTGLEIYFARPYCSTDRATNENTNGLLRDYYPKGLDFRQITHQHLAQVIKQLNNRPRKRLNYRTPYEVFHD